MAGPKIEMIAICPHYTNTQLENMGGRCDVPGCPSETPIQIGVAPQTVPTTASPFHPTATHTDALGMPVAFGRHVWDDDTVEEWTYLPTPCCGAAASISDPEYGMYCKACFAQVDPAFGNVPVPPFRPIAEEARS